MAETKISQLAISPSIDGTEYLIVDNAEATSRTTINSLSTVYSLTNKQEFNALQDSIGSLSGDWQSNYTTTNSNSANWSRYIFKNKAR